MIAPLAKFIDRSVLQIGYAMLPQSTWWEAANERDLKLEQAVQFLNGPDFIPAESQPAQLDFGADASGGRFLRFPTPRPCEFAENNVVHGRLYRCADAWQKRPVIILLHGGGDFPGHQLAFHLFARRCQRAGFNAATLELPYHFQTPSTPVWSIEYALPVCSIDQPGLPADGQDLCAGGCRNPRFERVVAGGRLPRRGAAGVSLGAYLAGLTGCGDARLASIVMVIPGTRMGLMLSQAEQVVGRRVREVILRRRTACEELDRTRLNLTLAQPAISKENVLLIGGMHDLMGWGAPIELWQSWGQPELWRLPHGHISAALNRPSAGLAGPRPALAGAAIEITRTTRTQNK